MSRCSKSNSHLLCSPIVPGADHYLARCYGFYRDNRWLKFTEIALRLDKYVKYSSERILTKILVSDRTSEWTSIKSHRKCPFNCGIGVCTAVCGTRRCANEEINTGVNIAAAASWIGGGNIGRVHTELSRDFPRKCPSGSTVNSAARLRLDLRPRRYGPSGMYILVYSYIVEQVR